MKMNITKKLALTALGVCLLLPAFFTNSVATGETWGVSNGDEIFYTMGFDPSIALPDEIWADLSDISAEGMAEMFNNTYGVEFPQSELDAVDLKTFYDAFKNDVSMIFNLKVTILNVGTLNLGDGYYWDIVNISLMVKRPTDSTYVTPEDFIIDFGSNELHDLYANNMPGSIGDNWSQFINEGIANFTDEINNATYDSPFDNIGLAYGTDQDSEVVVEDYMQYLAYDFLGAFGVLFERPRTYEFGWSQGYEDGYEAGWNAASAGDPWDSWTNPYEGEWGWGYEYGLESGWQSGVINGYNGYIYDNTTYYGDYYNNWHEGAEEFQHNSQPTEMPENYGSICPFLIPTGLDVGAEMEKMKDVSNLALGKSGALFFTGGFNGILEQTGIEFITNEKALYISGNLEDPKWMLGKIIDVGGMVFLDQVNMQLDMMGYPFALENDSLTASGIFNLAWDTNGVLSNYHLEYHVGVKYDVTNTMGVDMVFDLSKGEYTLINHEFIKPTQKDYPPVLNGNWGVTEGDINKFTYSYDGDIDLPQSMWDNISDELWIEMNDSYYYDFTDHESLPTDELVDAHKIFDTFMNNLPKIINLESKITDMLSWDWTDEIWENVYNYSSYSWEWQYVEDVHSQYDFLIHYLLGKTTNETEYQPLGFLIQDLLDSLALTIGTSFPETYGNAILTELDDVVSEFLLESYLPGTTISVLEILAEFVPSFVHLWGIYSNATTNMLPDVLKDMGIVDEMWFSIVFDNDNPGFISPPLLYTPTDFSFEDVYTDFFGWDEVPFTEAEFLDFITNNLSIDEFLHSTHELKVHWSISGTDDPFFTSQDAQSDVEEWLDELGSEFGEQFIYDSLYGEMIWHWRYGTDGVLDNFHIHFGAGVKTANNEWFEFQVESDISGGEYTDKNHDFTGTPLDIGHEQAVPPPETSVFNPFESVPGYEMVYLALAAIGTVGIIAFRKRK